MRDRNRLGIDEATLEKVTFWEVDFLDEIRLENLPEKVDVAYYLIHSMSSSTSDFDVMEGKAARNFNLYMAEIGVTQVVYLSGIVNDEKLSKHLTSQKMWKIFCLKAILIRQCFVLELLWVLEVLRLKLLGIYVKNCP